MSTEATSTPLQVQLAEMNFDGPHQIHSGGGFDPISTVFGIAPTSYAICLLCAAMVKLGDVEKRTDGSQVERGIGIHFRWHEDLV